MRHLDVWYARMDLPTLQTRLRSSHDQKQAKAVERGEAKARTKDSMKALARLTQEVDGEPQIVSDPPLIVPIHELATDVGRDALEEFRWRVLPLSSKPDRRGS